MKPLHIAHFGSEMTPVVKVGGLGDVVGALAREQARRGHSVIVVLPSYRVADVKSLGPKQRIGRLELSWGVRREDAAFDLYTMRIEGAASPLRVLMIDHSSERRFFDRPGVYDDPSSGEGYPDNAERYLFYCRGALEALKVLGEPLDVLHAHDHQAAWVPCFARTHEAGHPLFARAGAVFTIHNLGYQGIHDPWVLSLAGFGRELFYPTSPFEFWGRVNYMKVGLTFADLISTVSPRYAKEIQTTGEFGFGLEGVLARRGGDLRGILNGIDDREWDPARDPLVPHPYDREHPEGKWKNRAALAQECGFPSTPDWPIVGMVSRLVDQKGFDLIEQAERDLARLEARFVILGTGQSRYQELCAQMMASHPERVHYRSGFDEPFAHRIEAGCDLFLMPSRYEPCGLNQMYSLRYGTVPVVRATGGLADTVQDFDPSTRRGNGFVFQRYEVTELLGALRRAFAVYRQPHLWSQLRANGMVGDFSWRRSADGYDDLYAEARARVEAGMVPTLESVRQTS